MGSKFSKKFFTFCKLIRNAQEEQSIPRCLSGELCDKGMKQVLLERGLLEELASANGGKMVRTCADCKMSEKKRTAMEAEAQRKLEEEGDLVGACYLDDSDQAQDHWQGRRSNCCMCRVLGLQKDFREEIGILQ